MFRSQFIVFTWIALLLHPTTSQTSLYSGYTRKREGLIDDVPSSVTLSNGITFPLVGVGAGNLQRDLVESIVSDGIKAEQRIRMIDTAHASRNEALVSSGIVKGIRRFRQTENIDGRVQVHVVTKIWYTHLGYERTKFSVEESLADLRSAIKDPKIDLRVHMLIHWPACRDDILWMNCEEEENHLPDEVKKLGQPPHLNKDSAWKESWRALEDMYLSADYPVLASIGISNFDSNQIEELASIAREKPHMTQINVWSVLFDPRLVETCKKYNIHMQLYNVMNGIVSNAHSTPNASHQLLKVANTIKKRKANDGRQVHLSQTVLKWLLQSDYSVVVRTSDLDNLRLNSAIAIAAIPDLTEEEMMAVQQASTAMISGRDLPDDAYVDIRFHAKTEDMFLYFLAGENDYRQIAFVPKGESHQERTHPNSRFRFYHATDPDVFRDYKVEGKYGDEYDHHVEL